MKIKKLLETLDEFLDHILDLDSMLVTGIILLLVVTITSGAVAIIQEKSPTKKIIKMFEYQNSTKQKEQYRKKDSKSIQTDELGFWKDTTNNNSIEEVYKALKKEKCPLSENLRRIQNFTKNMRNLHNAYKAYKLNFTKVETRLAEQVEYQINLKLKKIRRTLNYLKKNIYKLNRKHDSLNYHSKVKTISCSQEQEAPENHSRERVNPQRNEQN